MQKKLSHTTAAPKAEKAFLLVFHERSSTLIPLPSKGELGIHRGEDGTLSFKQTTGHVALAKLSITGDEVILEPSTHGEKIMVNGALLSSSRSLIPGAVMEILGATVILHCRNDRQLGRALLDWPQFLHRLRQEIERSSRYRRPLALLVVMIQEHHLVDAVIVDTLINAVRIVDEVSYNGAGEFVILLPETDETAYIPANRVLQALEPLIPGARIGIAHHPVDGINIDTLLAGARTAACKASAGTVAKVVESVEIIQVAGQSIIVTDPKMKQLFSLVTDLAKSDLPVLVSGETGVGKEIVAIAIHAWSPRAKGKLVSFNCAAVAESLLESELFGHQRGAFTGAEAHKIGLLESAAGGTIVLDEVNECSSRAQAELLRVLETKRIRPVGSIEERPIDVRIIATTNRNLEEEVAQGRFRRDLLFRLNAATLFVPPLRHRMLDLPPLVHLFLEAQCARLGRSLPEASPELIERLHLHQWPGNIRELKNLMDYLVTVVQVPIIGPQHLPEHIGFENAPWIAHRQVNTPAKQHSSSRGSTALPEVHQRPTLAEEIRELECQRITEALIACNGVRVRAAESIGMPLRTLVTKIKLYNLSAIPSNRQPSKS